MSELERARDHHLSLLDGFAPGDDGGWLGELRCEAAGSFRAQGLPSTRQEEWRYTNLAALAKERFALAEPAAPGFTREELEAVSFPVFACSLYVFVDGRFSPELSAPRALSGETRVESLAELRREAPERLEPWLGRLASHKQHPFAALNTAFLDDGAALFVPPGVEMPQPIHLVFVSTEGKGLHVRHPRVLVVAGEGCGLRLIQDHVSLSGPGGFTNAVTEVHVGRDARVDVVQLQREPADAFHVSNLAVHQARDSRFSSHCLSLGGRLVRNDLGIVLADEGAECTMNGLFIGSGEQVIDNHTVVDHAMPHGTSRQLYKGILGGASRGVFRGRVIVRPDAQKTNAEQSNPNLLVGGSAEIDTKPQLEIHADDVKCSHGSSIGQLDPDALFYLRSRAISEPRARDLLTRGFASEILGALPIEALGEGLDELLSARLAEATGRREPS